MTQTSLRMLIWLSCVLSYEIITQSVIEEGGHRTETPSRGLERYYTERANNRGVGVDFFSFLIHLRGGFLTHSGGHQMVLQRQV